jgi:broad specificity phosphatase PhoE
MWLAVSDVPSKFAVHLYLIRHAESENNVNPEHLRVEDPAITERGQLQAKCLANWLSAFEQPPLVLSSPFRRALQTTAAISKPTNLLDVEVWCDVYERGGCYRGWTEDNIQGANGLGQSAVLELLPSATLEAELTADGWWLGRPREEDGSTHERARSVVRKLEQRFGMTETHVAIVTHAEFERILLGKLLSATNTDVDSLGPICNVGITYLSFAKERWTLQWFNSVTHMPHHLITGAKG